MNKNNCCSNFKVYHFFTKTHSRNTNPTPEPVKSHQMTDLMIWLDLNDQVSTHDLASLTCTVAHRNEYTPWTTAHICKPFLTYVDYLHPTLIYLSFRSTWSLNGIKFALLVHQPRGKISEVLGHLNMDFCNPMFSHYAIWSLKLPWESPIVED